MITRQLVLGLAAIVTGVCSRPVLYYPVTEAAPATVVASPTLVRHDSTLAHATPSAGVDIEYLAQRRILLPVAGADPRKLEDSFDEGRDGGERVHRAIDILAPRGTPILSADDGRILRMTTSTLGGISMYAVDPESRLVYYYAHMDRYNAAMTPGRTIAKGDTLGFVGTTGNAPKDLPHLHFQVMRWPADGKYWNGEPIDPFQTLRALAGRETGKR